LAVNKYSELLRVSVASAHNDSLAWGKEAAGDISIFWAISSTTSSKQIEKSRQATPSRAASSKRVSV